MSFSIAVKNKLDMKREFLKFLFSGHCSSGSTLRTMGSAVKNILRENSMGVILVTTTLAGMEEFMSGLINSGAEVAHARNGSAAIEMIKPHAPALVVIDNGLSDFNPFELAEELTRVNPMATTAVTSFPPPEIQKHLNMLKSISQTDRRPDFEQAQLARMVLDRFCWKSSDSMNPASHCKDTLPMNNINMTSSVFVLT